MKRLKYLIRNSDFVEQEVQTTFATTYSAKWRILWSKKVSVVEEHRAQEME
jgi:hypothetical protein